MRVDFYFDFSCPYAYLGSTHIESLCAAHRAHLTWKPFLLGGVLRALGAPDDLSEAMPAGKRDHNRRDMRRWAEHWGVPLTMPESHPQRTVRALRALLRLDPSHWPTAIHAIFRAYWVDGRSLAADLGAILAGAGVPDSQVSAALAAGDDPAFKAELRRRTDEALELGIFGAPTTVVHGDSGPELYWGQDRLAQVERRLDGSPLPRPPARPPVAGRVLEFFYDFSSPFAYLAAQQIDDTATAIGAELRWRPMLLGGLFRSIGTHDVPLFEMSESKQSYQRIDLERTAAELGVGFRFNSRFPIRSILPLRVALASGDDIAQVSKGIFSAAWTRDEDIIDPGVLAAILSMLGLDGSALVERASEQPIKDALRANTDEAAERGVFGAPTMIVSTPEKGDELYWGRDRLALLASRY